MDDQHSAAAAIEGSATGRPMLALSLWLSEASHDRLKAANCQVVDDLNFLTDVEVVLVSTRAPSLPVRQVMEQLRDERQPVVVVCHAGGEHAAVELMRHGARAVVAEGNEAAVRRLVDTTEAFEGPDTLVTAFGHRLDARVTGAASSPHAEIPGPGAFDVRFADRARHGALPRLAWFRIVDVAQSLGGLDVEAGRLIRRRLTLLFQGVARQHKAELFSMGDMEFAALGDISTAQARDFGRQLEQITAAFAPSGGGPLRLAFGHAGPEVAREDHVLRDLAERAFRAAEAAGGGIVGADELSRSEADRTELDAALQLAQSVDELDSHEGSHSSRVAEIAVELARELGVDGSELVRVRLAATLHDIGKIGLPPEVAASRRGARDRSQEAAWRRHSELGEQYALPSAGADVARAIRHHHECWDGTGFPDGLTGTDIPLLARIIAVADAYDSRISNDDLEAGETITDYLELEAGLAFDPTVVAAALSLMSD